MPNDVHFMVGLLTTIGPVGVRTAILIVEFARELQARPRHPRRRGPRRLHAECADRHDLHGLRLGVLPLAARQRRRLAQPEPIGIGVLGGMLAATFWLRS